jgi:hypothetical protein
MPSHQFDHDQFVFDKVTTNVAGTPAASHIAQTPIADLSSLSPVTPPAPSAPPADALAHFPGLPQDAIDHGHPPGWLLPGI